MDCGVCDWIVVDGVEVVCEDEGGWEGGVVVSEDVRGGGEVDGESDDVCVGVVSGECGEIDVVVGGVVVFLGMY